MSISLPNIRSLFLPDPHYTICECDLSGADAQVVAWEADDADLKEAFRKGLDVHSFNASQVYGTAFTSLSLDDPKRKKMRQQNKQAVHGTNYGAGARTLAQILNWTIADTEKFQSQWFKLHPGIRKWHERTEMSLRTRRRVTNAFGYSRTYFDRIDALLPQALAWIPQSTVALVTFEGLLAVEKALPEVVFLIQVHDSLVFQIETIKMRRLLPSVMKIFNSVIVPYSEPLTIPWEVKASTISWGNVKDIEWKSM